MNGTSFLKECEKSTQTTYRAFQELLDEFENPLTRSQALAEWFKTTAALRKNLSPKEMMKQFHFSISDLAFQQEEGQSTQLTLLQLPSTFAPEEWSFTFFEGLARYRASEFKDKVIAELGCGTGWISLALARHALPKKIYGLDINPKAIVCSKLNLYINSYHPDGTPNLTKKGQFLTDIVEFNTSDLLDHCRTQNLTVDRIIGCIPQVLSPDPEFSMHLRSKSRLENANDEVLHSLSNYTPDQGYIEDQFGLGLIARAIEESTEFLNPGGKLILNLGGRPGERILKQLFSRRGFHVRSIWQTRVSQAKDTDIQSLVKIEEKTDHRFEFFTGYGMSTPVSAKTGLAYAEAGGELTHALTVFEAQVRDSVSLPKILQFIREEGDLETRNSIDLSFPEYDLCQEKVSFLDSLIEFIRKESFFAYEETSGLKKFKARLSTFFRSYFKIAFESEQFMILPSRILACQNILETYRSQKVLLDSELASKLAPHPNVLEIPRSCDQLCELIEKLKPEIVICSLSEREADSQETFLKVFEIAKKSSSHVFMDISDLLELSSTPKNNGIFRYLAKNRLPSHVHLLGGLVKNRLYQDLEVCFVISENSHIIEDLEKAAELSYSRTPILNQLYYDRILQDLINFQIVEPSLIRKEKQKKPIIPLSKSAQEAFLHPSIALESAARVEGMIRLDYGENALPTPLSLKKLLFEAFAKKEITSEEGDCTPEVLAITRTRFILGEPNSLGVTYGSGIAPIFSELAQACAKTGGTFVFPQGTYGHFVASALFHAAKTAFIPTFLKNNFKISPYSLDETLSKVRKTPWVFLNAPLVNPTGAIYSAEELEKIMKVVRKHNGILILDSIFSGLEFSEPFKKIPDLSKTLGLRWIILGGLSKEYSAGGLRLGYGVSSDPEIQSLWNQPHFSTPHAPLKWITKKLYEKILTQDKQLLGELKQQKQELKQRTKELSNVLTGLGWSPLVPHGGLFLIAAPNAKNRSTRMEEVLRKKAGIIINPPAWTGIPNYYRFVVSCPRSEFDEALKRLKNLNHD